MKKGLKVLVLLCLLVGISGCIKPFGMNKTVYEVGCKSAEVVESYLDADITADEAIEKLESLQGRLDESYEDDGDDLVRLKVIGLSIALSVIEIDDTKIKDLEKAVKDLNANIWR